MNRCARFNRLEALCAINGCACRERLVLHTLCKAQLLSLVHAPELRQASNAVPCAATTLGTLCKLERGARLEGLRGCEQARAVFGAVNRAQARCGKHPRHNKAVNADAQLRPHRRFAFGAPVLVRRLPSRYAAAQSFVAPAIVVGT